MKRITSMMESITAHKKMIEHLRKERPANLAQDKEDGAEYVWDLNRASDPFHADGVGKTRHNEEQDG